MHPAWPLLVFSFLLSFTTIFYAFRTPSTIAVNSTTPSPAFPSSWGDVDSDFDWCELNNRVSPHVSEPFNTITSAAYPITALFAWRAHAPLALSPWHRLNLCATIAMGAGSMIFHGTLRYWAQLLDELPLYSMALLAAASLRQRHTRAAGVQPFVAGWVLLLTAALLFSERSSPLHVAFRVIMACSFSVAFVFIFTVGASIGNEIDMMRPGSDGASLFRGTFVSFVVAIASWIADIVFCYELQALPSGLPYPQLHAFGWHLGTCYGLLQLFCLMLLHQHVVRDQGQAMLQWVAGGLIPRVRPVGLLHSSNSDTSEHKKNI